jgi:hypothetical protein
VIEYPVQGTVPEITSLTKSILHELCDISPSDALTVRLAEEESERG